MTWVATAVAVAGAVLGAYNTRQVAKKQDNVAAMGIRKQAQNQREANASLNSTLKGIEQSSPDAPRATAQQKYMEQVQRSKQQATAGLAQRGISEQYDAMAGEAQGKATDYAGVVANLLSRIDAGSLQRQGEQNAMGNLGMDLTALAGNVDGDQHLTGLRMNGVRRNPWLDAAQGAASGYAQYAGGKG